MTNRKRIAIAQSNYIPWIGYFDFIRCVDEFIIYDVVQFTKNDWRNRNRIKTSEGPVWLTVPVNTSGRFGQTVAETSIVDGNWASKHWRTLSQSYARAPHFRRYRDQFEEAYRRCATLPYLSLVNRTLIDLVVRELLIPTRILDAADYEIAGDRNERLVCLCKAVGATTYVSGPRARVYLDPGAFAAAGIQVEFVKYPEYGPYSQQHGPFEPAMSVLDILFNVGPDSRRYLRCETVADVAQDSAPYI